MQIQISAFTQQLKLAFSWGLEVVLILLLLLCYLSRLANRSLQGTDDTMTVADQATT